MTRVLFLPNDQTFLLLDSPFPAEEVVEAVLAGQWAPPEPYGTALALLPHEEALHVFQQGDLVVITTIQPLELESRTIAARASLGRASDLMLTTHQQDVLQCLAEGLTTKEIALRLDMRQRTVAQHIAELKKRLGAVTRAQSVGRAAALGLCKPGNFRRSRLGT